MAQWGKKDNASNSVIWGVVNAKLAPNSVNQTSFFDNMTPDAFISGMTIGQFGVDTTEIAVGSGNISMITVTSGGSGYNANSTATFTGGGGSSAAATGTVNATTGKIYSYNITNGGSSYETNPTLTFAAPAAINVKANTQGWSNTTDVIYVTSANSRFVVGDRLYYTVPDGNTAITGLTGNSYYYVSFANTTSLAVSATNGGANVDITSANITSTEVHTLTGDTATGVAVVSGALNKGVSHAGWVVRKVGSGGRAGRVQYETLVAMSSIDTDASDDKILPDS